MNILRGISIVLLLFAYNANAKEATHNVCEMTQGMYIYDLSLKRCPELKKGDVIEDIKRNDAVLYCDTRFPIIVQKYDITCRYNGARILEKEEITVKNEVSNN
jgi:hypothetical protein